MASMTASTGGCGCGGGCGGSAGASVSSLGDGMSVRGAIERPRFFARQLVTPDDLTLGQEYFRNRLRRMNRYLHGWGVVCGARVEASSSRPWNVVVHPGYILGPFGDEIVIEQDVCFDVRTRCLAAGGGDACDDIVMDPLCPGGGVVENRNPDAPLYVALRYREMPARPVRVQPVGCGCDDTSCEYSRWRDGYELCVLDACPDSHEAPPSIEGFGDANDIPDCPPCPTDPWVVLAAVWVDSQGHVSTVENCNCRRQVRSLAPYWRGCGEHGNTDAVTNVALTPRVEEAAAPAPAAALATAPAPVRGGAGRRAAHTAK